MDEVKGDESLEEVFLELQNGDKFIAKVNNDPSLNIEIPKFNK